MKREEIKAKLLEAGVADDKMSNLLDFIMAQNGAEINQLKEELNASKSVNDEAIKSLKEENKSLKGQLDGYKDYNDLKQFKEETIAKADNDKKVNFLKAQGCKHPDLIMGKLDFSKAQYDESKNTYTGLDDDIKAIKGTYADLFETQGTQHIKVDTQPKTGESDFMAKYRKNNPDLKI